MLDTKTDLLQIVDGTQSVVLKKLGTNEQVSIHNALPRVSRRTSYAVSSGRIVPSYNATWHVAQVDLPERPRDGDELVAEDGTVWTIYKIGISAVHKTWRLITRSEILDFKLDDYVNILRAFAEPSGDGSTNTTVWRNWKTNVACKFAYDQIVVEPDKEEMPAEQSVRVYFKENPGVLKNDIVERPDGTQYKIKRIRFSRYTYGWTEIFLQRKV